MVGSMIYRQPIALQKKTLLWLFWLIFLFSIIALLVNAFFFHYPGNNYFPKISYYLPFLLFLMYIGTQLAFGKGNKASQYCLELI